MNAARSGYDVAIVGGGIIGCGLARELSGRGARVVVVERARPGAEASSAAAGMLAAQAECAGPGPLFQLGLESRCLHASWAEELAAETGIDVMHRRCGILRCSFEGFERLSESFRWQDARGLPVERIDKEGIAARTHASLSPRIDRAVFFPEEATVDPALLTHALAVSAQRRGATFLSGSPARRFLLRAGTCVGLEMDEGALEADQVVDAAGAWAAWDSTLPFSIPVEPVRGQIVELALADHDLATVVQDDDVYLVPRSRGRILVGSTIERVGFCKDVTAQAVAQFVAAASRLLPAWTDAVFVRAWAGLRPGTPDDLPILGASPLPGLWLAVGHYRNGILLAPATARALADLLEGRDVPALAPFSISRFSPAHVAPPTLFDGRKVAG